MDLTISGSRLKKKELEKRCLFWLMKKKNHIEKIVDIEIKRFDQGCIVL